MKLEKYIRKDIRIISLIILVFLFGCSKNFPSNGFDKQQSSDVETANSTIPPTSAVNQTTIDKPDCLSNHLGQIAFINAQPTPSSLFLMDGNGCNVQEITLDVSHTLAWAPVSGRLAVICNGTTSICILDTEESVSIGKPLVIERFPLPEQCTGRWIGSIDWSFDEKNLLITCGRSFETFYLVKIPISKEQNSQIIMSSDEQILRAAWSPVSDNIAVSIPPNIYLIDSSGTNKSKLTDGLSPIWSSDGTKIIFIKKLDDGIKRGIASITTDGTSLEWLFLPSKPVDLICSELRPDCRLTLSPDNKYLAFNGLYYPDTEPGINYQIFRLDLVEMKVEILSTDTGGRFYSEPDWGP